MTDEIKDLFDHVDQRVDGLFLIKHLSKIRSIKTNLEAFAKRLGLGISDDTSMAIILAEALAPDDLNTEQKLLWLADRIDGAGEKAKESHAQKYNDAIVSKRSRRMNAILGVIGVKRKIVEKDTGKLKAVIDNQIKEREDARERLKKADVLTDEQIEANLPALQDHSEIEAKITALNAELDQAEPFERSGYQPRYRPDWFDDLYLKSDYLQTINR